MLIKHAANIFYIYLGIILIHAIINLILLIVLGIDSTMALITNSMEVGDGRIILKIDQGNVNSDLVEHSQENANPDGGKGYVAESNNTLDSVVNREDKCIERNKNPLNDIHKRFLSADKSHIPSHFQKNGLPQNVPVYGNKLVIFKPSSLLQDRNLPQMLIEIPQSRSMGKLTELHKALEGADEAVKLYDSQFVKFNKVLSGIQNGTEEFYPNEARPLMETYVDLVLKLSNQQKDMANEAIKQLSKLDSSFSRDYYSVQNNSGVLSGRGTGGGTGIVTVTGTAGAGAGGVAGTAGAGAELGTNPSITTK